MDSNLLNNKNFTKTLDKYGTCLFIDTKALINNDSTLKQNEHNVAYVLKNNAYGLGVENIAPILYKQGNKTFFVATIDEGIILNKYTPNAVIYAFNGLLAGNVEDFVNNNITPVLNNISQIQLWNNYAKKHSIKLNAILNIETGINRLGLEFSDITYLSKLPDLLEHINIDYIMSHFACSDIKDHYSIESQYNNFVNLTNLLPSAKYSLCASYGVFLDKKYHFNLSRVGIGLYAGNPQPYTKNPMQTVVHLYSTIQQIKTLKAGEHVGYGYSWQCIRPTKLAILPIGYADGVIRSTSNKGFVYIGKHKAPLVGTISMDLTTVDITDIPTEFHKEGQPVEFIGNNLSLNQFATNGGTVHCEVLNLLTTRYPRIYEEL